jgi:hypothetical protein
LKGKRVHFFEGKEKLDVGVGVLFFLSKKDYKISTIAAKFGDNKDIHIKSFW